MPVSQELKVVDVLRIVAFLPALILGLVAIFESDTPSDSAYLQPQQPLLHDSAVEAAPRNREATASFWSRYTFSWCSNILRDGRACPQPARHRSPNTRATPRARSLRAAAAA